MQELSQTDQLLGEALTYLRDSWGEIIPDSCMICGSGWGPLADDLPDTQSLPYDQIPGLSATTVAGHNGQLHLCRIGDGHTLIFQGRRHFYEGDGWGPIRFPILLAHKLGIKNLLLTNAAGGIRSSFEVGDMMVLSDHLNFMGSNPLIGPPANQEMPRFPDQTEVYEPALRNLLVQSGQENDARIHEGVYVALSGPAFETPAEIRAFGSLGADAVGMSTVPEATLGHALGLRVCGLSCISNKAAGISTEKLKHEDVEEAAKIALPKMKATVLSFLNKLAG
ncbi:purine-nucleoside phosphorylase [Verrucomicrobia bacterium]|nr:purine-nucleoside phosphorylase [Verrucomicrobiota bacterium]